MYTFTIDGRIKPYVRMTQRGKWVKRNALEYRASQEAVQWQVRTQMAANGWEMLPPQTPLMVQILEERTDGIHRRDGDNTEKAVLDALNDLVYPDDRWVDYCTRSRRRGDVDRVTVMVRTMERSDQ